MQQIKKIEIVADLLELPKIIEKLDEVGITDYTIIKDVTGKGERGIRDGDELTDVFKNCYVLTACEPEQVDRVVETIRPLLKRYGGICLISDALWVTH